MSLKSLSTKLYLGIAVAALVMWVAGVSGGTILTLAAIGFMVAMHAGGHGSHGGGAHSGHAQRDDVDHPAEHTRHSSAPSSTDASAANKGTGVPHKPRGGCH